MKTDHKEQLQQMKNDQALCNKQMKRQDLLDQQLMTLITGLIAKLDLLSPEKIPPLFFTSQQHKTNVAPPSPSSHISSPGVGTA